MNWLKLKNDKSRFITSFMIISFYLLYFFIGSIASEWIERKNIWIANIIFFIINLIILCLINFELLKLFNLNTKNFIVLQIIFYISIMLMYLFPYKLEINDYVPYKFIDSELRWVHPWISFLFYLLFFFVYLLCAAIHKNVNFRTVIKLFFLTLFIVIAIKSITIIMLHSLYGWTSLLYLFLIVIFTDTFAYLGGTLYGKRKIAPNISPNKTLGGLLTGIFVGSLIPLIFAISLFTFLPNEDLKFEYAPFLKLITINESDITVYIIYVLFTIILSVVSQLGDLYFSSLKRKFNIKDFSNLLAGHGGILDRIDGLIFVAVFAFAFTQIIENI